jgi:MFS transporter, SP family, major inositol transporter
MQHDHQTGAQVRPGIHDFDAALGTILGIVLIGRINRRPLLLTGFTGVAARHAILALSFLLPESAFRSY